MTNVDECSFYHHMDLPGPKEVGRGWDLRKTVDDYLGNFDFRGKRALDVGTASGFLTFEIEKRGAEVVSFDMASSATGSWCLSGTGFRHRQDSADYENWLDRSATGNGWRTACLIRVRGFITATFITSRMRLANST